MSTSNSKHGSFLFKKVMKTPTQKGEQSRETYKVVPQTKRVGFVESKDHHSA